MAQTDQLPQVSNLPEMVANNPNAYTQLIGYQYRDPLSHYETFSGGPARGLGSSNGLVVWTKPNKKEGATAAVLADLANRQQLRKLEEALGGKATSGRGGTLGDLGGAAVDYIRDLITAAQIGGAGAASSTPAAESGAGRMGRGALPAQGGGGIDWGRLLGAVVGGGGIQPATTSPGMPTGTGVPNIPSAIWNFR